jgi:hypothetical protein
VSPQNIYLPFGFDGKLNAVPMAAILSVDGQDGTLRAQATGLREIQNEGLPVRRNFVISPTWPQPCSPMP